MSRRISSVSDADHQKKTGPKVIIEAILDLALIAGFLAATGLLITLTIRVVFFP
jgi:hypothetical protein